MFKKFYTGVSMTTKWSYWVLILYCGKGHTFGGAMVEPFDKEIEDVFFEQTWDFDG